MEIKTLTLGELATNCYIVISAAGNAAVIDPADDAQRILDTLGKDNAELKMILLTHGHFDHTGAVADLKEQTGAKVYIHSKDECMLDDTIKNVAYLCPGYSYKPFTADVLVSDGDIIRLDEIEFSVMHTPGHTAGSVVYFADNCMFAGDTIFEGSAGRTISIRATISHSETALHESPHCVRIISFIRVTAVRLLLNRKRSSISFSDKAR